MNTHLLALYVAAVFLAMIAPGPDMMFILSTGMRGGRPGGSAGHARGRVQ
jgi:threonine/homoserine/homoserine lactone efflux protein